MGAKLLSWFWPRRGVRRGWMYVWHRVTRISASPHVIALGFAAGVFASFTPFVGLHFVLAGILALVVGGNILASALGTFVGNPLTFPFIWLSTYNLGGLFLGIERRESIDLSLPEGTVLAMFTQPRGFFNALWEVIGPVVTPMFVGGVPLGLIAGALCYFVVYSGVDGYQRRRRHRLAVRYQRNKLHGSS